MALGFALTDLIDATWALERAGEPGLAILGELEETAGRLRDLWLRAEAAAKST